MTFGAVLGMVQKKMLIKPLSAPGQKESQENDS
jgi:hypothetical protein